MTCTKLLQKCLTLCGTIARQASLSMGFSRQEYWSGLPCPLPGDLWKPETERASPMSPVLAGRFFTTSTIWEPHILSGILNLAVKVPVSVLLLIFIIQCWGYLSIYMTQLILSLSLKTLWSSPSWLHKSHVSSLMWEIFLKVCYCMQKANQNMTEITLGKSTEP